MRLVEGNKKENWLSSARVRKLVTKPSRQVGKREAISSGHGGSQGWMSLDTKFSHICPFLSVGLIISHCPSFRRSLMRL